MAGCGTFVTLDVHVGYEVRAGGRESVHFGYEVHAGGRDSVHFGYEVHCGVSRR